MKNWEAAATEFLKGWKVKSEVIGAMICGSYITGNPSMHSDIDIHIILSDDVEWRERGNLIINGFLIEYFANPPRQIRGYFREDYNDHSTMSMVQFVTGRIVFDTTGVINELKIEAKDLIAKKHDELSDTGVELKKYSMWDDLDNLKDSFEQQRADFLFTYHNALLRLFNIYCGYLNLETISYYQIYSYLSDPKYLDKYIKSSFPDEDFKKLFIVAIQEVNREKMMDHFEELSNHVLQKMGGFEIDGWKLRSPLDL